MIKIILLALLAVICLAILGFAGPKNEPPPKDPKGYTAEAPYSWLGELALMLPGATYKLIEQPVTVLPGPGQIIPVKPAADTRVVRLALVRGLAARVTYCNGNDCSKVTCLVMKGFNPPPAECPDAPQDVRGFALEKSSGTVKIEAILNQPVQVESR